MISVLLFNPHTSTLAQKILSFSFFCCLYGIRKIQTHPFLSASVPGWNVISRSVQEFLITCFVLRSEGLRYVLGKRLLQTALAKNQVQIWKRNVRSISNMFFLDWHTLECLENQKSALDLTGNARGMSPVHLSLCQDYVPFTIQMQQQKIPPNFTHISEWEFTFHSKEMLYPSKWSTVPWEAQT